MYRAKIGVPVQTKEALDAFLRAEAKSIVHGLGMLQVANIKARTQAGRDIYDRQMPRYTPAYAKFRAKKGRDATRRNLLFRGHMMRGMFAVPNGDMRIVIKFTDPMQRIKARANHEIAPWFGVSEDDFQKLSQWLRDRLRRKK
jgi:hypothetical protein